MASKVTNKTYKCPFCEKRFNRSDLVDHVEDKHEESLPEGFSPFRFVFHYVNKKPLTYHGICTECKGPTDWDEERGRYKRQCNKQACHDSYIKKFEQNMVKTKGVTRISATREGQIKMLQNRKISGVYKFANGQEKPYTGKYELATLEFMDKMLHIDPNDILSPGPILEYKYKGKTHIYITDFYYQPYNLVIEVKDGGDNPNNRDMPEYRAKQIAKENYIIKHTNYNYLRLTNKNMAQLISVFMDLKMQMIENTGERVIHVNEKSSMFEAMGLGTYAPVIGIKQNDQCVYIKNYMQNHAFSGDDPNKWEMAISRDYKFDTLFRIKEGKIIKQSKEEALKDGINFDNKVFIRNSGFDFWKLFLSSHKKGAFETLNADQNYLYKLVLQNRLYTPDQIFTEDVKIIPDYETYFKILESVATNYILSNAIVSIQEGYAINYATGKNVVTSDSGKLMSETFGIDNNIIKHFLNQLEAYNG